MSFYRDTWEDKKCHKVPSENLNCELVVDRDAHSEILPLNAAIHTNGQNVFLKRLQLSIFPQLHQLK